MDTQTSDCASVWRTILITKHCTQAVRILALTTLNTTAGDL